MFIRMNAICRLRSRSIVGGLATAMASGLASMAMLSAAPFEDPSPSRLTFAQASDGQGDDSENFVVDEIGSGERATVSGGASGGGWDPIPDSNHLDPLPADSSFDPLPDSGGSGVMPSMIFDEFLTSCDQDAIAWVGRVDALIAWRNAPPDRPLIQTGLTSLPVLNANGMDSTTAAGPRVSLFRFDHARGTGWETTFFQIANWRSERPLAPQADLFALAPPGLFGNSNTFNFDTGFANLGSRLKSLEVNRHWVLGEHVNFLAGFRWAEWRENFSLVDEFVGVSTINDFYATDTINSLYGGQIGLDSVLFTLPWMRFDSVVKAGVYYNNATQQSVFQSNATGPLLSQSVTVNDSPLSASFIGEVGITGVVPVTSWLDVRIGYSGWWLSGVAQATQQLSGQVLTQPAGGIEPTSGSINANGGVLVQAVTVGLEGRW